MHIQIFFKQKPFTCNDAFIERAESLWQKIKHEQSTEKLTWCYAEYIDLSSDVYIEVLTEAKLRVGVIPTANDRITSSEVKEAQLNDLHWVIIEDATSDQVDLISKFLLFMIGMVFIPSQIGSFMTDWADLRVSLQYGNTAKYVNLNECNAEYWANLKTIACSVMLLNEDLSFSKKLNLATNLIPQAIVSEDYLSIINITDSNYLPRSNILLLVYKD